MEDRYKLSQWLLDHPFGLRVDTIADLSRAKSNTKDKPRVSLGTE